MANNLTLRQKLDGLARNLLWTWSPDVVLLFQDLNPELWEAVGHNPLAFLSSMPETELEARVSQISLKSRINYAYRRLGEYMGSTDTWAALHAGVLNVRPVAYFSAEFGIHESVPLYSGGLGILAGDHMKSASDLGLPLVGVGLFYVQGYFHQALDKAGWQEERYGTVDMSVLPIERARTAGGLPLTVELQSGAETVQAAVWRVLVGRCQLLLLDTDTPANTTEYREITKRLYWGDQRDRIRQEIVLGIGGMRAVTALGLRPGVLHLNEGHSAFAILEAIRMRMEEDDLDFDEAAQAVGGRTVFTTHTPVPAGHDRFPGDLVLDSLDWLRSELGLSEREFLGLGRVDAANATESFCMTVLALRLAHRANGVSAIHGEVSRRMWQDLWPHRALPEVPIGHITNGIHTRSWLSPQLSLYFERRIHPEWTRRLSDETLWRRLVEVDDAEIWEAHGALRQRLVTYVRRRFAAQETRRGTDPRVISHRLETLLDDNALTIGFARRFATYKRATLLLRDRARLARLLADPERPVQILIAGKAHPRDEGGKQLIQEWARLQHEEPFAGRVVFLEDYDIDLARHLVQGVDVWLNNPKKPEEACGTSGMKVAINGGLNLSILDGWWAEAFDGRNGFAVGGLGIHRDPAVQDARDYEALLSTLEAEVVPLFYDRNHDGLPHEWIDRIRWSLMSLVWRFSADRMVIDYATKAYLPAAGGVSARIASPG